jgi:hypothetical protein
MTHEAEKMIRAPERVEAQRLHPVRDPKPSIPGQPFLPLDHHADPHADDVSGSSGRLAGTLDEVPVMESRFRATLAFAMGALIAQLLLGIAVNLFVKIPTDHPGANPPEYFGGVVTSVSWAILHGGLWLTLHAAWGLVLVLAAVGTLVQPIGITKTSARF